jgi:hypothetical protein
MAVIPLSLAKPQKAGRAVSVLIHAECKLTTDGVINARAHEK